MWRRGVPRPLWRPSHHISHHHYDRQPLLAYAPGVLAIVLIFSYNARSQQESSQQQQQQQQQPGQLQPDAER